jgi:hypothetical protein
LLQTNKVLVAGGQDGTGRVLSKADLGQARR